MSSEETSSESVWSGFTDQSSDSVILCPCNEPSTFTPPCVPQSSERGICECPKDEHQITIHDETCSLFKNETIIFPHEPETCECQEPAFVDGVCACCGCLPDQCRCKRAGREAFDEWRNKRDIGEMPAVLEATHPLMQRFQQTLKEFLIKENAIAEEEIVNLKDDLRTLKLEYEKNLEGIYKSDHDTNTQRTLIEEYETTLLQRTTERQAAEKRAQEAAEMQKRAQEKLEQNMITERETREEFEALTTLCNQLEKWREETESDLTVSQRMSNKMRQEKRVLAEEKRELDMVIFTLSNEVWKLESKLELFQKQLEIKNNEMEKVNDKVTAYAAELEDLELDKRRLVSLWNSVLVNIKQRDVVYDSVREDYKLLQENFRTLVTNLEITKNVTLEEMRKGKEIAMTKDKLTYDLEHATKLYDAEDQKRVGFETQEREMHETIELAEKDQNMVQMENQSKRNVLKSSTKELERKNEHKLKLENEILSNLQECLLNDKAVESMANGIKKMREMSRKQEIALMSMENQHAKLMLDIEVHRNRQAKNKIILDECVDKVREREKEIAKIEADYDDNVKLITRKQRELDIIMKKFNTLNEIFGMKSPQQRRIEELEQQIKAMRDRTEGLQHEWLRLQGHVVKLTEQHHKVIADINLIKKQIQICEQKTMRIQAECENVLQEKGRVERTLRELRGKLEVLERTRKDSLERNDSSQRNNLAITHEYAANLKGAETDILQIEEEIEAMDKDKMNLTQELDRAQREALIWQRKGILAVELKKNMHEAKSAAGEIGQMRNEIHRMEVRREQLRRTGEKLAEDLALYVTRRETAMEKSRAAAAVEKAHGGSQVSQSSYHHKLRLARTDVARVTKELAESEARMKQLQEEQERLEREVTETNTLNAQLEEQVAVLIRECRETERQKQWFLERVIRNQRLGTELATVIKRQSLRVRKPKSVITTEYTQARALNDRLQYIADRLGKEYPHFAEKLASVSKTLEVHTPSTSPRLADVKPSFESIEEENIAEKPMSPF